MYWRWTPDAVIVLQLFMKGRINQRKGSSQVTMVMFVFHGDEIHFTYIINNRTHAVEAAHADFHVACS